MVSFSSHVKVCFSYSCRKIVNGLRDDDDESIYTGRHSFASEYSTREVGGEALQVFVKEHGRSASKGSTSSFVSRKKTGQGKSRPETKVCLLKLQLC